MKWLKRGSHRLSAEAAFALRWKTKTKQQIYRWWMSRSARKRRKQEPQAGAGRKGETDGRKAGKLAASSRSVGAKRKTEGSQHPNPGKRQKTLVQMWATARPVQSHTNDAEERAVVGQGSRAGADPPD